MTAPNFGYSTSRPTDDIVSVKGADFSKNGYCSTSEDADASVFPVNVARRFTSTDPAYLSKLGTGELAAAIAGLNDQLGGDGADVTVVRVAAGTDANPANALNQTFANILGDAGLRSGLWALRNAPATVKAAPKLISVPGYTYQQPAGQNVANPIVAALAAHLDAMGAISVVDVDATSMVKAIAARETMNSMRMMPLGVAAKVYETVAGASTLVTRPMSPRVLGLIVATDNNNDGKPFDSFANKPIQGIADISRPINFDLGDGSTEGQLMLASDVAIVAAGATATPGAIADGGFTFIGVESAYTSDLWSQIHQVRGADYIDLKMQAITRQYLGGRITPRRAEGWLAALKFMLLDHVKAEDILGFKLEFPAEINSINDVAAGTLHIRTFAEPAPVFRKAVNELRRYRPAVQALIDAIVASSGSASATV